MSNKYVFGIDLGTTNSALACYTGGYPETVLIQGNRTLPSVVWYRADGSVIVGDIAYKRKGQPDVVYSSKRDMGTDKVYNLTLEDGTKKTVTPIMVASEILKAIVRDADTMYGEITEAVITVPAYFNDKQRTATRKAAELAGIKLINIINEPTAAALAYGMNNKENSIEKIIVTDIGGGTSDITLMTISNFKDEEAIPAPLRKVIKTGLTFDAIATGGNNLLGGDDYDKLIFNEVYKNALRNAKTEEDKESIKKYCTERKLMPSIELWKKESDQNSMLVEVKNETNDKKYSYMVNPEDKEFAFMPFWKQIDKCIEETMNVYDIDTNTGNKKLIGRYADPQICIPVGGSTKNILLQQAIKDKFKYSGMEIPSAVFADEAIALGAAISAAITKGIETHITLKEINPLPIGIETVADDDNGNIISGIFGTVIDKDIPIPIRQSFFYETSYDNQTLLKINVYQGLSRFVKNNQFIGELIIRDLPPKKAGEVVVEVQLEVSIDGKLSVSALYNNKLYSAQFNSILNSATREYSKIDESKLIYLMHVKSYMEDIGCTNTPDYFAVCNWEPGNEFPKYAKEHTKEVNKFIRDRVITKINKETI